MGVKLTRRQWLLFAFYLVGLGLIIFLVKLAQGLVWTEAALYGLAGFVVMGLAAGLAKFAADLREGFTASSSALQRAVPHVLAGGYYLLFLAFVQLGFERVEPNGLDLTGTVVLCLVVAIGAALVGWVRERRQEMMVGER